MTFEEEQICREVFGTQKAWEAPLNKDLQQRWSEEETLGEYPVPRSITHHQEETEAVELHAFEVGVAVYSVVHQPSGTTQQLVAAKSCLFKKKLTMLLTCLSPYIGLKETDIINKSRVRGDQIKQKTLGGEWSKMAPRQGYGARQPGVGQTTWCGPDNLTWTR